LQVWQRFAGGHRAYDVRVAFDLKELTPMLNNFECGLIQPLKAR